MKTSEKLGEPGTIHDLFAEDNFTSRRTTGHNLYDPESLITGAELARGLDYGDKRDWSENWTGLRIAFITPVDVYRAACVGEIPVDLIPVVAPRTKGLI